MVKSLLFFPYYYFHHNTPWHCSIYSVQSNYFLFFFMFAYLTVFIHSFYQCLIVFSDFCTQVHQVFIWNPLLKFAKLAPLHNITGPFRRFPTPVWQNVCVNTSRHAMVCDVYFSFSKIL